MAVRRRRRVMIVGGGIGGLTAGAALRAAGHEPAVLERARTIAGRTLSCLDGDELERRAGAPLVVLHRGDLQRMLAAAAGEALVLDTEVAGTDALECSVRVRVADGAEFERDVLIGADGLHSVVTAARVVARDLAPSVLHRVPPS